MPEHCDVNSQQPSPASPHEFHCVYKHLGSHRLEERRNAAQLIIVDMLQLVRLSHTELLEKGGHGGRVNMLCNVLKVCKAQNCV